MLPFLPALLLLLIQGPSSFDCWVRSGHCPEGFAALQRCTATGDARESELAIESLRRLASEGDVASALQWIFARLDTEPAAIPASATPVDREPIGHPVLGQVPDGYSGANRSRDGPLLG